MNDNNTHYIYLLREREFIRMNEDIYKIGKTKQPHDNRFRQYPKGSDLILQIKCVNCDTAERTILNQFKQKYRPCRNIGNEYFEGNYIDMINTIMKEINVQYDEDATHTYTFNHHKIPHPTAFCIQSLTDKLQQTFVYNDHVSVYNTLKVGTPTDFGFIQRPRRFINPTFTDNESYLHKSAKIILSGWLHEYVDKDDFMKVVCESNNDKFTLRWRRNSSQSIGYPLSTETASFNWVEIDRSRDRDMDAYRSAILQGQDVVAMIDVVVIRKGCPIYLFEICDDKKSLTPEKLNKIKKCIENSGSVIECLIEIDTSWIMSQFERPPILKVKNIHYL